MVVWQQLWKFNLFMSNPASIGSEKIKTLPKIKTKNRKQKNKTKCNYSQTSEYINIQYNKLLVVKNVFLPLDLMGKADMF